MNNAHYVKVEDVEEWAALCGKFKQERDEAREQLIRSNHFLHQAEENLESIYRERDEAREKYFALRDLSNNATELAEKYKQERDDAMEELKEYRSIAENIGAKKAVSEKEKAIRERDEWRECADIIYNASGWHDQWPVAAAHYKKLKKKYE